MLKFSKYFLIILLTLTLNNCGGFKKVDQRERPTNPEERRRQAVSQGQGTGINDLFKNCIWSSGKNFYLIFFIKYFKIYFASK